MLALTSCMSSRQGAWWCREARRAPWMLPGEWQLDPVTASPHETTASSTETGHEDADDRPRTCSKSCMLCSALVSSAAEHLLAWRAARSNSARGPDT